MNCYLVCKDRFRASALPVSLVEFLTLIWPQAVSEANYWATLYLSSCFRRSKLYNRCPMHAHACVVHVHVVGRFIMCMTVHEHVCSHTLYCICLMWFVVFSMVLY